tara:strand:- start:2170 stop:2511 length:342 start_codon:yes stop_codon:yes gene_type:complete
MSNVLEISGPPRQVCTNGMVEPKPSFAEKLLAKLNDNKDNEAHIKTDKVFKTWSSWEKDSPEMDCTEAFLRLHDDGSYYLSVGYTTESGRFLDCWGWLGCQKETIFRVLDNAA